MASFMHLTKLGLYATMLGFFTGIQVVNSLCSGSGFPLEWITTATPGMTYWYVTPLIKRQFGPGYEFRDFFTDTGVLYAPPPQCQSEYYDPTTGYHYYLMYYTQENVYSLYTNLQICHALIQHDGVIREYFEDLGKPGVLSDAKECVPRLATTTWSMALTKYNFAYVDCPFSNEEYYFTFSKDGKPDYCSGLTSSAFIDYQTISLKSCFNPDLVDTANPFYGAFSCLTTWKPEAGRDTSDGGNFIVLEMYDGVQWPYCGRYKVDANGVITMSLYLSIPGGDWYPTFCDGSVDNTFINEDGSTIFTRLVFKPVNPRTTTGLISTTPLPTTTRISTTTKTTFPTTTNTIPTTTPTMTTPTPTTTTLTTTTTPTTITTPTTTTITPTSTTTPTTPTTTLIITKSQTTTTTAPTNSTTAQTTNTPITTTTPTTITTTTTTQPTTTTTSPTTTTTQPTTTSPTTTTTQPTTTASSTTTTTQPTTTTSPTTTTLSPQTTVNIALGNSTMTLSFSILDNITNLDWRWWILIAASLLLLTMLTCCIIYAELRRRRKSKVDDSKQTTVKELNTKTAGISNQPPADNDLNSKTAGISNQPPADNDLNTTTVEISNQPPADHAMSQKSNRPKVQRIQVKNLLNQSDKAKDQKQI